MALAVLNNKEGIATKVDSCKQVDDDGELELWCEFAQKDVKPCCKWFTGENCSCKNCDNVSMPKTVAWFSYIFHHIEEDDLALEISVKICMVNSFQLKSCSILIINRSIQECSFRCSII